MSVISPRRSNTESFAKAHQLSDVLFQLTTVLAYLPDAIDAHDMGDDHQLNDIRRKLSDTRELICGKDPSQRLMIKPITESKVLRTLDWLMRCIDECTDEGGILDADKMTDKWGVAYAKFLAACEDAHAKTDSEKRSEEFRHMRSGDASAIPTKTTSSGIVVYKKAPLVFVTDRPIPDIGRLPKTFETIRYAGGYVMNNQTVIGVNRDDTDRDNKVDAALRAFTLQGEPMINVLDNNMRTSTYFIHRGNPLMFTWLFPRRAWDKHKFKVVSVEFNTTTEQEVYSPYAAREKVKHTREQFETFLASNAQYKRAMKELTKAKDAKLPTQKLRREITNLESHLREVFRDEYIDA